MSIYAPIEKFLTVVIEEYQMEARRVGNIAAEGCSLAPYNLKVLIASNARAQGALEVQTLIRQTVAYSNTEGVATETAEREALPRIVRALGSKLDFYLQNEETHIGTLKVINDVLISLQIQSQN